MSTTPPGKHIFVVEMETDKPINDLIDLVGGRMWSMDHVVNKSVVVSTLAEFAHKLLAADAPVSVVVTTLPPDIAAAIRADKDLFTKEHWSAAASTLGSRKSGFSKGGLVTGAIPDLGVPGQVLQPGEMVLSHDDSYESWMAFGRDLHEKHLGDRRYLAEWHKRCETSEKYDPAAMDRAWAMWDKTLRLENFDTSLEPKAYEGTPEDLDRTAREILGLQPKTQDTQS